MAMKTICLFPLFASALMAAPAEDQWRAMGAFGLHSGAARLVSRPGELVAATNRLVAPALPLAARYVDPPQLSIIRTNLAEGITSIVQWNQLHPVKPLPTLEEWRRMHPPEPADKRAKPEAITVAATQPQAVAVPSKVRDTYETLKIWGSNYRREAQKWELDAQQWRDRAALLQADGEDKAGARGSEADSRRRRAVFLKLAGDMDRVLAEMETNYPGLKPAH